MYQTMLVWNRWAKNSSASKSKYIFHLSQESVLNPIESWCCFILMHKNTSHHEYSIILFKFIKVIFLINQVYLLRKKILFEHVKYTISIFWIYYFDILNILDESVMGKEMMGLPLGFTNPQNRSTGPVDMKTTRGPFTAFDRIIRNHHEILSLEQLT